MDVELPHFWTLKSTVRLPEQEAIVASKSFCIFSISGPVRSPPRFPRSRGTERRRGRAEDRGRLFAELEPSRYPTSRPATSAN
jgi:hypothetical protein